MVGKKGQGKKVARPYGFYIKVTGPKGPTRTEHWYESRSDRDRNLDSMRAAKKAVLLESGKLGIK